MANAQLTWVEDMQFVARAGTGHAIVMDATVENGGFGSASSPMEVLLMGVLGCTAMDVISILKKKRQPVEGFKIFATGERAAEHPKAYTAIHLEYVAYGEVDPEALTPRFSFRKRSIAARWPRSAGWRRSPTAPAWSRQHGRSQTDRSMSSHPSPALIADERFFSRLADPQPGHDRARRLAAGGPAAADRR